MTVRKRLAILDLLLIKLLIRNLNSSILDGNIFPNREIKNYELRNILRNS
jgi:hypothetical protein